MAAPLPRLRTRPTATSGRPDRVNVAGHGARYVELAGPEAGLGGATWNFDGHFVTIESFSPTNRSPSRRTFTITPRPSRNGSGTMPV